MLTKIKKRDGRIAPFDKTKIADAIFKAALSVGGTDRSLANSLADKVVAQLEKQCADGHIPNIEEVQDAVEKTLIEEGHAKTAKTYILYRQERAGIREEIKRLLNGKDTRLHKKLSLNAIKIIAGRYLARDENGQIMETPEQMFERVSRTLADVERKYGKNDNEARKFKEEFYGIMTNMEFLPAGRTLANAGAPTRVVANCIVLHMEDSMDGIFQTLKDASLLQQAGSGLGFPFHLLRPAGTMAKKSRGVASGPVSFLRVYDKAFGVIKQQGRHGANMAVMRVDHPDILEFIHCKAREGDIRNFNISVAVTDDFMEKVLSGDSEPWLCEWNGMKMKPRRIERDQYDTILDIKEETITPRELMEEIVNAAWRNGEPGVIFIDHVNDTNPLPGVGRIEACNPCVTGDSLVSTEHGFVKMETLAEKYSEGGLSVVCDNRMPVELLNADGTKTLIYKETVGTHLNSISNAWKTGHKDIWKIETDSGYELEVTSDHKIMTTKGWVKAEDLHDEEILIQGGEGRFSVNPKLPFDVQNVFVGNNGRTYRYNFPDEWTRELGQFLGWLVGDGWIRDKEKEWMVGLTFGKDDKEILGHIKTIGNKIYGRSMKEIERQRNTYHLNYGSKHFVEYLKRIGVKTSKAGEKEIPEAIFAAPKEAVSGFLQGLFSSDGTVMLDEKKGNYYVRLTTKSIKLAKQVQLLLLNLGILSQVYDSSRESRKQFSYTTKAGLLRTYETDGVLFEVNIHGKSIEKFSREIGFLCNKHKEKMQRILQKKLRVEKFTDKIKTIEYAGKKDVYDLTEPATHSFIANGFVVSNCGEQMLHDGDVCNLGSINLDRFVTADAGIDWERLREVTRLSVRMLDNVVDITDFPVERVAVTMRANRRVGLGVMGFADMLLKLRVPYNSPEGFAMAEKVMAFINDAAHEMSRELAEEKGVFPNWHRSVFAKSGVRMRNAALTSIAPTGTISMICDVSSGIEPYFALVYQKSQVMGSQSLFYVNSIFEDELKERGLYSEEMMQRIVAEGTVQGIPEIPEDIRRVFVTSMDIMAEDHVRTQAAFQKRTDNSISKTCNFPNSATKEDVLKAYLLGWQLGCKSLTVYRSGSRETEVLHLVKEKKEEKPKAVSVLTTLTTGKTETMTQTHSSAAKQCPNCDIPLTAKEGCFECGQCGFGLCES
ncbi:MAG: ribonucleoside reductase class II [Candidatus Aenigmarchaeota archaeon]|nr:ribonucleoside reductase class II [Candidatus Aenigmarchaeota archaeon]